MSFSKVLLNYGQNLKHWNLPTAPPCTETSISLPGAVVKMQVTNDLQSIFYSLTSGSLSPIEMAFFEALADYQEKFKTIPTLRELDFYLRDTPSQMPWPNTFSVDFIKAAIEYCTQVKSRSFAHPIDWLKQQLGSQQNLVIKELANDMIVVEGSKKDAWSVEKNFDEWQKNLRINFNRPHLVLLFAIKS
jgi:hypothetical protein